MTYPHIQSRLHVPLRSYVSYMLVEIFIFSKLTNIKFDYLTSWIQENKELKNTMESTVERAYMHGRKFIAVKVCIKVYLEEFC